MTKTIAPVNLPPLRDTDEGYQQLRQTLETDLPTQEWAVPADILREAGIGWRDGPDDDDAPAPARKRN
eukprot:11099691-Lingulodinium_polyedra.AAC.1